MKKAALIHAHLRAVDRARYLLSAVERDLEVFSSELCPDLHEINAQLDKFSERIQHYALNQQSEADAGPPQDDEPASSEA